MKKKAKVTDVDETKGSNDNKEEEKKVEDEKSKNLASFIAQFLS